jgi:hypothetical protein
MKLTYDPRYNIAYLRLLEREEGVEVETIRSAMPTWTSPRTARSTASSC